MTAYFVKPSASGGSDAANGLTLGTAWATLTHASGVVVAGDVVHFQPGTYTGGLNITSGSGTSGAHITYISDVPAVGPTGLNSGCAKFLGGSTGGNLVGVWLNNVDYVDFIGFEIDGSASADWWFGVLMYGTGGSIQKCHVHHTLSDPTNYSAAVAGGNGGSAIELADGGSGQTGGSIIGNVIHDHGIAGWGGSGFSNDSINHGIYVDQKGSAGNIEVVKNNLLYNCVGSGIQLWHGARYIDIINNTVYQCHDGSISIGSGDSGSDATTGDHINCRNNVVMNCYGGIYETGTTGVNNVYQNNQLFGNTLGGFLNISLQNGLTASNTLLTDPLFRNAAGFDFRLLGNSPCINSGVATGITATDITGRPRVRGTAVDRGAYEFQPRGFFRR